MLLLSWIFPAILIFTLNLSLSILHLIVDVGEFASFREQFNWIASRVVVVQHHCCITQSSPCQVQLQTELRNKYPRQPDS